MISSAKPESTSGRRRQRDGKVQSRLSQIVQILIYSRGQKAQARGEGERGTYGAGLSLFLTRPVYVLIRNLAPVGSIHFSSTTVRVTIYYPTTIPCTSYTRTVYPYLFPYLFLYRTCCIYHNFMIVSYEPDFLFRNQRLTPSLRTVSIL
jgi:hypothetical protein